MKNNMKIVIGLTVLLASACEILLGHLASMLYSVNYDLTNHAANVIVIFNIAIALWTGYVVYKAVKS